MTTLTARRTRWLGAAIIVAFGGALLAWAAADARPAGRGGGGARMNVGRGFNGPRSFNPPPRATQLPSGGGQLGSQRPGGAPRPSQPIANAPPSGSAAPPQPTHPIVPQPSHPIVLPPQNPGGPGTTPPVGPGTNPPERPIDRPPGTYYPPYGTGYWPPYPSYWPPPYPIDGYEYSGTEPPTTAPPTDTVVGALPADCRDVGIGGSTYKLCGSTWYAPRFSGNQVVYVVVDPPTSAPR